MVRVGYVTLLLVVLTGCAQALSSSSDGWTTTLVLDDFSVDQQELGGNEDQYNSANGTMLGGNRDQIYVNFEYGDGNWENISKGAWSGYGALGSGAFALQYDGADETKKLDTNGLGNIDLTANGGTAFQLDIWSEWGGEVSVLVYTNNGTQSCSLSTDTGSDWSNSYYYYLEFSKMPQCDFTQVSAVELAYPYPSISMGTYSFAVATNGTVQPAATPSVTPTPTRTPTLMPSPSPTSSYIMPTAGPTQELDFGFPVTVSVSSSVEATFQTQQIDASSISSISFTGDTASQVRAPGTSCWCPQ